MGQKISQSLKTPRLAARRAELKANLPKELLVEGHISWPERVGRLQEDRMDWVCSTAGAISNLPILVGLIHRPLCRTASM